MKIFNFVSISLFNFDLIVFNKNNKTQTLLNCLVEDF